MVLRYCLKNSYCSLSVVIDSKMSKISQSSATSLSTDGGSLGGIANESLDSLITTVQLDGTNFIAWSQSIKLCITRKGKGAYLSGATKMPTPIDSTFEKWEAENAMVMSWLIHSMQSHISNNYLFLPTTKAI